MTFKPGDVLFWDFNDEILLILEVNFNKKQYKVFTLSSKTRYRAGKTNVYYLDCGGVCLLKDKNLNEI